VTPGRLKTCLAGFLLLFAASSQAAVTIETQSLRLQFSDKGDLLRAEACFPACAAQGAKTRLLSAGQGLLVFDDFEAADLQVATTRDGADTSLAFTDASGAVKRQWLIPDVGWRLNVSSSATRAARLMSGVDFRPLPSSGFGDLLERTRYLVFDGSSVETIGLDDAEPATLETSDWFGFRNRFWTVLVRPGKVVSMTVQTGETVQDALVKFTGATREQDLDLALYLGPVEPHSLADSAPELEGLMYSGLWFWLRWICQALYWLLNLISLAVPPWGLAVMALSLAVNILMRPLSMIADRLQDQVHETEARLAPKLAAIKKEYKGEQQSEKIIAMYKAENVHPLYSLKSLAGVFVVIPVFIGAFDMLAENIHLSGESFLWIADLSHPDAFMRLPFELPFFGDYLNLLPFIMTGLSFIASKLHSHPAMDAAQRRRHSRNLVLMALGFLVLFYTFPAGMVLYWTTNNLISVVKTLWKKRRVGDN
jgi:YidC/Oxa1 family membrane protein insertase